VKRREALAALAGAAAWPLTARAEPWHAYDVTGISPSLTFTMQATPNGRTLTQADLRGNVTMLYFGYTFCPDVCPLTVQNVTTALAKMGDAAKQVRFLFVTVDPGRDTMPALAKYVSLFGPNIIGLRGDDNELMRLAKRYRIAYSVDPSPDPAKYEVSHSSVIYVFDKQGDARLLVSSLADANADIDGLATDLQHLVNEPPSWWSWLRRMV
jgi:protein SCO1/2